MNETTQIIVYKFNYYIYYIIFIDKDTVSFKYAFNDFFTFFIYNYRNELDGGSSLASV